MEIENIPPAYQGLVRALLMVIVEMISEAIKTLEPTKGEAYTTLRLATWVTQVILAEEQVLPPRGEDDVEPTCDSSVWSDYQEEKPKEADEKPEEADEKPKEPKEADEKPKEADEKPKEAEEGDGKDGWVHVGRQKTPKRPKRACLQTAPYNGKTEEKVPTGAVHVNHRGRETPICFLPIGGYSNGLAPLSTPVKPMICDGVAELDMRFGREEPYIHRGFAPHAVAAVFNAVAPEVNYVPDSGHCEVVVEDGVYYILMRVHIAN